MKISINKLNELAKEFEETAYEQGFNTLKASPPKPKDVVYHGQATQAAFTGFCNAKLNTVFTVN